MLLLKNNIFLLQLFPDNKEKQSIQIFKFITI